MGETYAKVAVKNPADPERVWKGEFLVDTGAHNSVVPRKHLEAVGIGPMGTREFVLADGSTAMLDIANATLEFMGQQCGMTVVFGDDDVQPLLGVIALEDFGVQVDPKNQRLTRRPHRL